MRRFLADLHIHTALSPCGSDEMTPPAIVAAALDKGLAMIAICDHNTAGNARAVQGAAGARLTVLAGMEITTAEEVHVLGIFPNAGMAAAAGQEVCGTLPQAGAAYYRRFGGQPLMDENGTVLGMETKMLAAATPFDLAATVGLIRRQGGLAIASHVDRPSYSIISQLGMFPADVTFDAVEVSRHGRSRSKVKEIVPAGVTVVTSSDSHYPWDVGTCFTELEMYEPTFDEFLLALRGDGGRGCRYA